MPNRGFRARCVVSVLSYRLVHVCAFASFPLINVLTSYRTNSHVVKIMILVPYIKFGMCHQQLSFAAAMGTVCDPTLPLGGGAREYAHSMVLASRSTLSLGGGARETPPQ